jgi:hypothetical protein
VSKTAVNRPRGPLLQIAALESAAGLGKELDVAPVASDEQLEAAATLTRLGFTTWSTTVSVC